LLGGVVPFSEVFFLNDALFPLHWITVSLTGRDAQQCCPPFPLLEPIGFLYRSFFFFGSSLGNCVLAGPGCLTETPNATVGLYLFFPLPYSAKPSVDLCRKLVPCRIPFFGPPPCKVAVFFSLFHRAWLIACLPSSLNPLGHILL